MTFDCAAPAALAEFWAFATGGQVQPPPAGFDTWSAALTAWGVPESEHDSRSAVIDPDGVTPRLFFQCVPEPKTAKNRVHLDLRAAPGLSGEERRAAIEARAAELVARGARVLNRLEPTAMDPELCLVMADPEGNEFCLD
ncbi:VOC family protein [Naumannella halotolerans]|uniref:VOC family protein n=1 Tax=Naumannella halotolerans TaxID=993414 RepID=UPI00370D22B9